MTEIINKIIEKMLAKFFETANLSVKRKIKILKMVNSEVTRKKYLNMNRTAIGTKITVAMYGAKKKLTINLPTHFLSQILKGTNG